MGVQPTLSFRGQRDECLIVDHCLPSAKVTLFYGDCLELLREIGVQRGTRGEA